MAGEHVYSWMAEQDKRTSKQLALDAWKRGECVFPQWCLPVTRAEEKERERMASILDRQALHLAHLTRQFWDIIVLSSGGRR